MSGQPSPEALLLEARLSAVALDDWVERSRDALLVSAGDFAHPDQVSVSEEIVERNSPAISRAQRIFTTSRLLRAAESPAQTATIRRQIFGMSTAALIFAKSRDIREILDTLGPYALDDELHYAMELIDTPAQRNEVLGQLRAEEPLQGLLSGLCAVRGDIAAIIRRVMPKSGAEELRLRMSGARPEEEDVIDGFCVLPIVIARLTGAISRAQIQDTANPDKPFLDGSTLYFKVEDFVDLMKSPEDISLTDLHKLVTDPIDKAGLGARIGESLSVAALESSRREPALKELGTHAAGVNAFREGMLTRDEVRYSSDEEDVHEGENITKAIDVIAIALGNTKSPVFRAALKALGSVDFHDKATKELIKTAFVDASHASTLNNQTVEVVKAGQRKTDTTRHQWLNLARYPLLDSLCTALEKNLPPSVGTHQMDAIGKQTKQVEAYLTGGYATILTIAYLLDRVQTAEHQAAR